MSLNNARWQKGMNLAGLDPAIIENLDWKRFEEWQADYHGIEKVRGLHIGVPLLHLGRNVHECGWGFDGFRDYYPRVHSIDDYWGVERSPKTVD